MDTNLFTKISDVVVHYCKENRTRDDKIDYLIDLGRAPKFVFVFYVLVVVILCFSRFIL